MYYKPLLYTLLEKSKHLPIRKVFTYTIHRKPDSVSHSNLSRAFNYSQALAALLHEAGTALHSGKDFAVAPLLLPEELFPKGIHNPCGI